MNMYLPLWKDDDAPMINICNGDKYFKELVFQFAIDEYPC